MRFTTYFEHTILNINNINGRINYEKENETYHKLSLWRIIILIGSFKKPSGHDTAGTIYTRLVNINHTQNIIIISLVVNISITQTNSTLL